MLQRICRYFLVYHHCVALHRGPLCEGLHHIKDGAVPDPRVLVLGVPTIMGSSPPRRTVAKGDLWAPSNNRMSGMPGLRDAQTLEKTPV